MNLETKYAVNNPCYKAKKYISPKGIMVHSTATPGVMADKFFTMWNKENYDRACVHAFVDDTKVLQILPWNMRGWHCGGKGNDTHIGFEICEPSGFKYVDNQMSGYVVDKQEAYFTKVYNRAVKLCAYLCKRFNLTEKDIICHSDGNRLGIASNHADVMHWFPKHNKSMDSFREAVRKELEGDDEVVETGKMIVNGKEYKVDRINKNGRNFVSLANFKKMGFEVGYIPTTKTNTLNNTKSSVNVNFGENTEAVETINLNGTNYIKIRDFEKFGFKVGYDAGSKTVNISR